MRPEQQGFVQAWSTATGAEQWVPAHFFDSPVTSRGLTRENPNPPAPDVAAESAPSMEWTREQLDTYAASQGLDTSGEANKTDALAVITAHIQAQQQDNTNRTTTETPRVGENQE